MPSQAWAGTSSPRARASSAAHTGWVATRATDDATVVNDRLGTQVAKWADRNSPASRAPPAGPGASRAISARRRAAHTGPRTATAKALRQKATASAGARASRISGAAVDTAATATAMRARSRGGGRETGSTGSA